MSKPTRGRPVAFWTADKIAELKKLYPVQPNEAVAEALGATVSAMRNKAQLLRLKKKDGRWPIEDEQWLVKNYPLLGYKELEDHLGRGKWAIINKHRELTGKR